MFPFVLFARRAGVLELDGVDLFAIPFIAILLSVLLKSLPRTASGGVSDLAISYGGFLACFAAYSALRKWLIPRQSTDFTKD
jgi:hypothetical protein